MKFKNQNAYRLSTVTSLIVLFIAYAFGIYSALTVKDTTPGDGVAVLIFASILTPGTILIAFKNKLAVFPIIILYFLAFFTFVTPLAGFVLMYALYIDRR